MLNLTDREWGEVELNGIFPIIQRGKRLKTADHIKGKTPYISSSAVSNGVDNFISNKSGVRNFKNCLTIANSGSVGKAFYHPYAFVASDHVTELKNDSLCRYVYQFMLPIISRLSEKYNFNHEINDVRIRREKILLPITADGKPDWAFMEQYVRERENELIMQYKRYILDKYVLPTAKINIPLEQADWKEFVIGELFDVTIGQAIDGNKVDLSEGKTAYITRKESNNGLDGFIDHDSKLLTTACPVITIGNETAEPFVQVFPFFTGTKVNILSPKVPLSSSALLFAAQCLKMHKDKFSYSFTINSTRLRKQSILLPSTADDMPDWMYMEKYVQEQESKLVQEYKERILVKIDSENCLQFINVEREREREQAKNGKNLN